MAAGRSLPVGIIKIAPADARASDLNQLSNSVFDEVFVLNGPEVMAQFLQSSHEHAKGIQLLFAPAMKRINSEVALQAKGIGADDFEGDRIGVCEDDGQRQGGRRGLIFTQGDIKGNERSAKDMDFVICQFTRGNHRNL
jgi:hypothetical protein